MFFSSSENPAVYEINVEEYGTARQATYGNIILRICIACWIQKANKHTNRMCNTYCFSTVTMVRRRRLCFLYTYIACLASACTEEFILHTCIHPLL